MNDKHIFVTALGNSPYERTKYVIDENFDYETEFVQEALLELLPRRFGFERWHKIFVILTPEAKAKNWEGENKLKDRLIKRNYREEDLVPIHSDSEELWSVLRELYDHLVGEEGELYLHIDITHAFRHMPMFMMLMIHYLEVLIDHLKIKGIYYGKYERGKQEAPIKDLTIYNTLMHLIEEVHAYKTYGRVSRLEEIRKELKSAWVKDGELRDQDGLGRLFTALKKLNERIEAIVLCRGKELYAYNKDLQEKYIFPSQMSQMFNSLKDQDTMAHVLKPLFDVLREDVKKLNAEGSGANRLLNAAKFAYEHKLYQQSVTLLREWVITYCMEKCGQGERINNDKERECYEKALHRIGGTGKNEKTSEDGHQQDVEKCMEMVRGRIPEQDLEQLASLFANELSQLRNDMNHAGFRESPRGREKIIGGIKKCFEKIDKIVKNGESGK